MTPWSSSRRDVPGFLARDVAGVDAPLRGSFGEPLDEAFRAAHRGKVTVARQDESHANRTPSQSKPFPSRGSGGAGSHDPGLTVEWNDPVRC